VSDFAKPLWNIGKKVAKFIPGASDVMEGIEGVGEEFLSGAQEDAEEAGQEIEDMGEALRDTSLRTYRDTQHELEEGIGNLRNRGRKTLDRGKSGLSKLKNLGTQFMTTVRDPRQWKQQYADDDDEEDNNLKIQRKKARDKRRRQRRTEEELDY
jgi:hypothetical protein